MIKHFLIATNFGSCYLRVDSKWKRALRLAPWIVMLLMLSMSMALVAASSQPQEAGFASFFVAIGLGTLSTFLIYAAFFSWRIALSAIQTERSPPNPSDQIEKIEWRPFGFVLLVLAVASCFSMR
ncbi:hypothetical protein [Variovorax sp. PBL-E5]|uniref:hypothetical protein n=1 Tax=Variovorax sp. PBL-E5 TaxID=434014 RepID=UPI0013A5A065|nr:hypothetical protein [Variovorax sp. PBL-E5]